MKVGVALLAALLLTSSAAAANPEGPASMAAAVKALHYPKPATKVTCKTSGGGFRCKALYRHHRHKVFYASWANTGGWVCAGLTLTGCKILRRGFVSKTTMSRYAQYGGLGAYAGIASTGYVENKYQATPDATSPCAQDGASSWACGYTIPTGTVTIKITYRAVKTGWLIGGSG